MAALPALRKGLAGHAPGEERRGDTGSRLPRVGASGVGGRRSSQPGGSSVPRAAGAGAHSPGRAANRSRSAEPAAAARAPSSRLRGTDMGRAARGSETARRAPGPSARAGSPPAGLSPRRPRLRPAAPPPLGPAPPRPAPRSPCTPAPPHRTPPVSRPPFSGCCGPRPPGALQQPEDQVDDAHRWAERAQGPPGSQPRGQRESGGA